MRQTYQSGEQKQDISEKNTIQRRQIRVFFVSKK